MAQRERTYGRWKGKTPAYAIAKMIEFHEGKQAARGVWERLVEIDEIINAARRTTNDN